MTINHDRVYARANEKLYRAFRASMPAPAPQAEPPPIDVLWQNTNMGHVQALAQQFGKETVARWMVYMNKKEQGR